MAKQRGRLGKMVRYPPHELLLLAGAGEELRAMSLPGTLLPEYEPTPWEHAASEEKYKPLPPGALEAAVLRARLANLLSRMESLEGAIASAVGEMNRLGRRVEALEQRLAEQGIVRNAMLCDLGHEGYTLKCPISVVVDEYDEETVARFPEVEAFASAATEGEAIALLKEDIVQLYEELVVTDEDELGKLPRQWRRVLSQLIQKDGPPQR